MASISQKTTLGNNPVANRDSDALAEVIRSRDSGFDRSTISNKGVQIMPIACTSHPLDPLTAAEISVAVGTVRASGETPEIRDGMRFIEVALLEPEKHVVALADAYFFPPFQSSLAPRTKGGLVIPSKLPPRQARLIVYNKKTNETSIWVVELSEVHAATRGGHHRGKVISSHVVPEVHPAMVESWRASNKVKIKYELLHQFVGIAYDLSSLQFCIKKRSFLFLFLIFLSSLRKIVMFVKCFSYVQGVMIRPITNFGSLIQ